MALILLASGESQRFGKEDKLLANLNGHPVLAYAANCLADEIHIQRIAVIRSEAINHRNILKTHDWEFIENTCPHKGQGHSLSLAIKHIQSEKNITGVIIILADMPFVSDSHIRKMMTSITKNTQAVISQAYQVICPPAIFMKSTFHLLSDLKGDKGAKTVFSKLEHAHTVDIDKYEARDIDTASDLKQLSMKLQGNAK